MKRMRIAAVLISCIVLRAAAPAQTTVYISEPTRIGARALGFAGAVAGDNADINVLTVNPGALSFLPNSDIMLSHVFQQRSQVMEENLAIPLFLRRGEIVGIALSVNHVGYATESSKTKFKVMQYGYDVAYARRLDPTVSLGGTLHVRYARSEDDKLWGLSSSFGLFYYPAPSVSYGLSLTRLGKGIKYIYNGSTTKLNDEKLPGSIHAGSTFRWPASLAQARFLTLTVEAEKVFKVPSTRYFGGIEFIPSDFAALRVGYFGVSGGASYASYGVTLRVNGWRLDIGATPGEETPQKMYQATLSLPIWNQFDEIY